MGIIQKIQKIQKIISLLNHNMSRWNRTSEMIIISHLHKINGLLDSMHILRHRLTPFSEIESRYFGACEYRRSLRLLRAAEDLGRKWNDIREQNVVLDDVLSTAQKGEITTLMSMVNLEQMKFAAVEETLNIKITEYKSRAYQC